MKKFKWIAGGLLALILIVVIAGYIILSTYDFNDLKPRIAQAVKDATGRELTLKGDIDLKISLSPALVVEDVAFQNAPWGSRPQMATIKRAEVEVSLIPLFSGELELVRLILVEPDILLETDKDGRSNLDFETPPKPQDQAGGAGDAAKPQPEQTQPSASGGGSDFQPVLFIRELMIEQALLRINDGQTGGKLEVKLDELLASGESVDSKMKFSIKGAYNNNTLEYTGEIGSVNSIIKPGQPFPFKVQGTFAGAQVSLDGVIKNLQEGKGYNIAFGLDTQEIATLARVGGQESPIRGPLKVSGGCMTPRIYWCAWMTWISRWPTATSRAG